MTEPQTDNPGQATDKTETKEGRMVNKRGQFLTEGTHPAEARHSTATAGHYQSLIETMNALKRPILAISAIGIILQLSVLIAGLATLAPGGGAREFEPMEICYHGMKAIFQKSDHGDLLHESVLEDIKKHQFNFDRIVSVKVTDSMNCTVSAKFADGTHPYRVKLEKSPRFKYGHRILDARGGK